MGTRTRRGHGQRGGRGGELRQGKACWNTLQLPSKRRGVHAGKAGAIASGMQRRCQQQRACGLWHACPQLWVKCLLPCL